MFDLRIVVALTVICIIVGCGASEQGEKSESVSAVVEIDIFSGVPNPEWALTGEEAEELARWVQSLPPSSDSLDIGSGGLGFRGFVVRGMELDGKSYETVYVVQDVVALLRTDGPEEAAEVRTDIGREIHLALRSMAQSHVTQEIYDAIPD